MDVSVIIVNYNVRFFLEQCLISIRQASKNLQTEVFVVDNNSADGSTVMIRDKFREVTLIANDRNLGFSAANNQALKKCSGKYILILNPDTVIREDSLEKCFRFMEEHPDAGAMGVKMIDGKGNYLPESKRALPTPGVAFFKVFGFSSLFPGSSLFSRYHLGHLDAGKTHPVDVLPGAFMFIRRQALEKTGYLDEDFFMYGEDIDLSYRLIRAGYGNYYFPGTTIIHYKGESTKKGSINYVVMFYRAMIIFARKHFSKKNARIFSFLISLAIYFRAFLSIAKRLLSGIFLPLSDGLIFFLGFCIIKPLWEQYRFRDNAAYPEEYMQIVVPLYILVWILSALTAGGYDKPLRPGRFIKGVFSGTVIILIVYALLPEQFRFSRIMILLGTAWVIISGILFRLALNSLNVTGYQFKSRHKERTAVAGYEKEASRITQILSGSKTKREIIGYVSPSPGKSESYLGNMDRISDIVRINRIDEIIFCSADISISDIMKHMTGLSGMNLDFKIAPPETVSVIGSNSIDTAEDLYLIGLNTISSPSDRRKKRLFDILSSLFLLGLFPLLMPTISHPAKALGNITRVLAGKDTWVGLPGLRSGDGGVSLALKPGIFAPADKFRKHRFSAGELDRMDMMYAKRYRYTTDLLILLRNLNKIGKEKRR